MHDQDYLLSQICLSVEVSHKEACVQKLQSEKDSERYREMTMCHLLVVRGNTHNKGTINSVSSVVHSVICTVSVIL